MKTIPPKSITVFVSQLAFLPCPPPPSGFWCTILVLTIAFS